MRRVACVALPQIRIEIAREVEPPGSRGPLAIVVSRPGGAVKGERDVLGNTRLDVVSKEARASGVRAGHTVAAARAKCAELHVRVVPESSVRTALARVAEVALAVGPSSAFDVASDVVWVEVGGCAHLHGGERELAVALARRVEALGHACRVALADGPRLAAAVARFGARGQPSVVPPGQGAAAMKALPVDALDLDDDCARWLRDLGLRTCGDLQGLPRRSLGTRLGARTQDVMKLLSGEDREPLDVWRPPEVPEERIELEWGAESVEGLAFVSRALCNRLSARLEGRAVGVARLALLIGLDRALLDDSATAVAAFGGAAAVAATEVSLPVPIARAHDLFAVVRARLEHIDLPAPALSVTLRALELASVAPRPLDLLAPEPKAARALPSLVAELAAELGPACVGTLALADAWAPEARTKLVPFGAAVERKKPLPASTLVTSALEPTRLVFEHGGSAARLEGSGEPGSRRLLARLEAVEWWRRGAPSQRRDFYEVWSGDGLAWAEGSLLRGWID